MGSYQDLKDEIKRQKQAIEEMDGQVVVANNNPSPAEITAGIKTIPSVDLSFSTATEEDVAYGKTFYSGNAILKTGQAIVDQSVIENVYAFIKNEKQSEDTIYYVMPSHLTTIRSHMFECNYNNINFTFNPEITEIEEYAFNSVTSFTFTNFNNLQNLTKIQNHAFAYGTCDGIDYGKLPNCVKTIGSHAFYECRKENLDFKFPDALESIGANTFQSLVRLQQGSLDLSNFKLTQLPSYCFYNHVFHNDFVLPASVTSIGAYFNYSGSFTSMTFGPQLKTIGNYCFYSKDGLSPSEFFLTKIIFEAENPPSIGYACFGNYLVPNNVRIYVPDVSVEAYKAITNLSKFVNLITPMSQMP